MTTDKLLESLLRDVKSIISTVETEFAVLPLSALRYKQAPDRWSVLECLEHLNRYSNYYHAEIIHAIEYASKIPVAQNEVKSTWLGKKFIAMMHPDNVKPQKTFKRMNPSQTSLDINVLDTFVQNQYELLDLIKKSATRNLNKTKIPVEFMKFLKLTLGDTLRFVVVHQQRHIRQANRITIPTAFSDAVLKV